MNSSPNADHIQVWNDIIAPKFTRFRNVFVEAALQHSRLALEELTIPWGARVLDVGCGFGETSIDLACRVGSSGRVVGIDCMRMPIETARADATRASLSNVQFVVGDAQTHAFDPVFDVCFSRFGTMFFCSPVAALTNLRRALVPGGRLLMIVWRTLDDNPYMRIPKQVALEHLPPHDERAPSCGPGPFSMAHREAVTEMLHRSGYVDVAFRRIDVEMSAGETVEDAVAMALAVGPAGEILREAGPEGEKKLPLIETELRSVFGRYLRDNGVFLASSSWAITASSPVLRAP
jgi:ubiquinone/menaquinone biosynthesis C-methylase UbiE